MVKIQQTSKGQYVITLPKALVKAKGWDKGTELMLILNNRGNIEIVEAKK